MPKSSNAQGACSREEPQPKFLQAIEAPTSDGTPGRYAFDIEAGRKKALVEGLDEIAGTLARADDIAAFENQDADRRPWLYNRR